MKLQIFQIDSFTGQLFSGNPAAVVALTQWLTDEQMLNIAAENNLSNTAFFIPSQTGFHIRWFTPGFEADLCGHATLAAAYVIFKIQNYDSDQIRFVSRSGELIVTLCDDWFTLNLPADHYRIVVAPPALVESFKDTAVREVYRGKSDYMIVLGSEQELITLDYDIIALSTIPARGIIVTAAGNDTDFVSRYFAPQSGIDEDQVTGCTHTTLVPYWAEKLSKTVSTARQLSRRGGTLRCELIGDRVCVSGQARLYMRGEISVD
ncbi:isomerase [Dyadobacter frigoris]|uniref:PhzF family phenazine biosynthesis protein n=1 Tax=Dyadobacter frigoris TaxID=2576211 RepID=UPI0024A0D1F2|nr:PhzF family phenazine biosynthesis protein [Dyadobacter frigoris]GLU56994.1 isomerase [Dyadobacter frigoris]